MSRHRTIIRLSAVLAAVALAMSCGGDSATAPVAPEAPRPATLTVSPPTAELAALGASVQLRAEVRDQNGQVMAVAAVTWASSKASVATVDASGLVTGAGNGTATVTATASSAVGRSEITVAYPERAALVALYEATGGPDWVNNDNWLTDAPLEDWYGVEVDGRGRVSRLSLSANSLTGPIPPELGNLANLGWLYLAYNSLTGPIPPELGNLAGLMDLFLDHNNLWGPIPGSLLDLTKLNRFPFHDTSGLCAPATTDFVDWLGAIEESEGPFCNESDRAVLAALFEAAGGSGWTNAGGWFGEPTLAGWHGVRADSLGRVTALDLSRNGLAGQLPGNLGELAHMTELRIADNADLALRLPPSLSGLSLRVLHYAGTELCVPVERSFRDWLSAIPSHEGTGAECASATLSGTVSHGWGGWIDPQTNGFGDGASYRPGSSSAGESGVGTAAPAVTTPDGYVIGAVVEVVDGPDAGRQTTTDDRGRYVLEALQQGEFTIRAMAKGFASVGGVVDLASDIVLDFAISQPPTPQPTSPFPDTDPAWLRTLSSDYPYAHQVANVRVFSDISPTFSREHAEHLKRVWDFFNALYVKNRGDWYDVYYTTREEVFLKLPGATIDPNTRNVAAYFLDYPRWVIMPYTFPDPDFGTQLHEIGHDFPFAVWPQAWDVSLWFVEGTATYWEGGVFTDDGSLRVPPSCHDGFPDPGASLIPLAELLHLGDAFYPDPRPTYLQSCMLFTYLEQRAPGVMYALIYRINSGEIITNDQLITAILDLTGKSISELEEAYQSYAWSMR